MVKGSYCLILKVENLTNIQVGSLGKIKFDKGMYIYVGSALNGLESRITRHLKKEKKLFWHIDYLTTNKNVSVKDVYLKISDVKEECKIAKVLSQIGTPVKSFGCSDCKCKSHLFKILDVSDSLHQN